MRIDVGKSLENFDDSCFREGHRNNDIVNWTLLTMMNGVRTSKNLLTAWRDLCWAKLDDDQKYDLYDWEEDPEEKILLVYDYYNHYDYDDLEDLLIRGAHYLEYTA